MCEGTTHRAYITKTELLAKIKEVFQDLLQDTVRNACTRYKKEAEEAAGSF